ncbi:MAG: hypothetical protein ITG02_13955 [Patulibacter sp.]|nr:hypothetical protein [Patulibacter sp.]
MQLLPTRPTKSWLVTEYAEGRPTKVYESVRHDAFVTKVIAALHGEDVANVAQPAPVTEPVADEAPRAERLKVAA